MFKNGTSINGKYRIERVIGSGGMGTVYEATCLESQQPVALKLLHRRYKSREKALERFHQEAHLASLIAHKNVCEVIDHGTTEDGAPYLVMPMLKGRSLAELLATKTSHSIDQLIDIVCQTLSALEAAHKKNVVHRDLKPDNIFVIETSGHENFVKLLDFGISKVIEQSAIDLTTTGMVLGTAYYLAPERAKGIREIDHRVDIYAMGVILYEILTGQRPFAGETYNEVLFKIAGEPYPRPTSLNHTIPRRIEDIILKAMSIDPLERFESAKEMRETLKNAMAAGPEIDNVSLSRTMPEAKTPLEFVKPQEARPSLQATKYRRILIALVTLSVVLISILSVMLFLNRSDISVPMPVVPAISEKNLESDPVRNTAFETNPPSQSKPSSVVLVSPVEPMIASDPPKDQKNKNITRVPAQKPKSKRLRKKRPKPQTKEVGLIKGRFGTTFIFDENE